MRAADYADLYALEEDLWWFGGMRAVTAALLDPVCVPGRNRLVLDAGCGTGANLSWLARYAGSGHVVGIDLVSTALHFCRRRAHRHLAQASITDLPFADRLVDLLTSFDVLGQVPGATADQQALREIHRVLRPGGIAFIRVAAYQWMRSGHDDVLGTHRRYSLARVRAKIESAGLRVVRATYANSVLLPVAMVRRLVLTRVGLGAGDSDVKPLPPSLSWLNGALRGALEAEARVLRHPRATLPAGLSAICVAERAGG
ncbi:MAG: class I SAM-dependent methyltransferase [Candidatus Rokuibacteriota bacterium]